MCVRRVLDAVVPSLPELPEALGIDEFHGNINRTKYHCILTDLSTSKPIDILNNRTEVTLVHPFRKYQHTGQLENFKFIVIDLWFTYYTVLHKRSDHLLVNDTVNEVRQRDQMLEFFPDLKTAYELKEEILWMIREVHDGETARQRLDA